MSKILGNHGTCSEILLLRVQIYKASGKSFDLCNIYENLSTFWIWRTKSTPLVLIFGYVWGLGMLLSSLKHRLQKISFWSFSDWVRDIPSPPRSGIPEAISDLGGEGMSRPRSEKDQNAIFRRNCFKELKTTPKPQTYPKMSTNRVDLVLQI